MDRRSDTTVAVGTTSSSDVRSNDIHPNPSNERMPSTSEQQRRTDVPDPEDDVEGGDLMMYRYQTSINHQGHPHHQHQGHHDGPSPPPPIPPPASTPTATRVTTSSTLMMTLEQLQLASALPTMDSNIAAAATTTMNHAEAADADISDRMTPLTNVGTTTSTLTHTTTTTPVTATSSSSQYSYPVATFVRDLIRTNLLSPPSTNSVTATTNSTATAAPTTSSNTTGTSSNELQHRMMMDLDETTLLPLSIRSEDELLAYEQQQQQQQHRSNSNDRIPLMMEARHVQSADELQVVPSFASSTTNISTHNPPPDFMLSEEEYIVVDGDLIAVRSTPQPTLTPRHNHDDPRRTSFSRRRTSTTSNQSQNNMTFQEQLLQKNQEILSNSCQPRKMRRGIRKLTKLFSRGNKDKGNKSKQQPSPLSTTMNLDANINDEEALFGNQTIELSLLQVATAAPVVNDTDFRNSNTSNATSVGDEDVTMTNSIHSSSRRNSPQRRPSLQQPPSSKHVTHHNNLKKPPPSLLHSHYKSSGHSSSNNNNTNSSKKLRWGRKKHYDHSIKEEITALTMGSQYNNNTSGTFGVESNTDAVFTSHPTTTRTSAAVAPATSTSAVPPTTSTPNEFEYNTSQFPPLSRQRLQSMELPVTMGLEPPSTEQLSQQEFNTGTASDNDYRNQYDTNHDLQFPPRPPLTPPRMHPFSNNPLLPNDGRQTSVTASYVGTADILLPSPNQSLSTTGHVQSTSVAAESFVEEDLYDAAFLNKKEDDMDLLSNSTFSPYAPYIQSLIPDALHGGGDLKVDKADAPDVEAMLRRALMETTSDLEYMNDSDSEPTNLPIPLDYYSTTTSVNGMMMGHSKQEQRKSVDGQSIPLSSALPSHTDVHNDTLKLILVSASSVDKSWVARRLRNCDKRARPRSTLAVDVHEWVPPVPPTEELQKTNNNDNNLEHDHKSPIKCVIWDVQGASTAFGSSAESRSNFGAHPGTQSLFFSPQSLYLLCWDLGCTNAKTNRLEHGKDDDSDYDDDDEDDDDYDDDFIREEANRQADRALHADIIHRVLSWYDCIARSGPRSAVLPIALVPEGMSVFEIKRRCDMMRIVLEDHFHRNYELDTLAPKLLTGTESSILCVNNFGDAQGIKQLQEMVGAIANDPSNSVFDHVGTLVPIGTVLVREAIQRFKEEHKLILLDHLLGDLGNALEVFEVTSALHFLASIGEILYFGTDDEDVLSRYIILSRKWLISALSCILRNDLKRELTETRRFMNMQCIYSDQKYEENGITAALISGKSSSCPLLSDEDAKMLWQSMSFMREASDRYSNLMDRSTTIPTMFYFLERLLVHSGVFLPLRVSQQNASLDQSEVFFVPSLLSQADPTNMWTYMTSESWMTTLCHSWLFRDGAPPSLIEYIAVQVLRDLYDFSTNYSESPNREVAHRIHSAPVTRKSFEAAEQQVDGAGRVHIHHVVCFKSSMLIKIGTIFADDKSGNLRESFVEIFVAVVDQTSSHTVASDVMRPCMQRVIVSGKGQVGRHGHKLWKGGYRVVFESVQNTLATLPNVDAQAICPECLATCSPRIASTWGWDVVSAAAKSGNPHVICLRGHRVNSNLICGTVPEKKAAPFMDHQSSQRVTKNLNIKDTLPSVVLVGVWDPTGKCILSVGSGCIVDKKAGFVVTAGHVMFNMDNNSPLFGVPYFGCRGARAVVAVIPNRESKHAVFRYFAEIVASDVRNVDACILQIRARMENDVDDKDGVGAIDQPEKLLAFDQIAGEDLRPLKLTKNFDIAESVRLLGYSQEGEGIFEIGKHISPSVEFVEGRIHRLFKATRTEDDFDSDSSSTTSINSHSQPNTFVPREEIILHCLVNSGHSGGPCVNSEGKVVGILSRSDPVQRDRCYLVPTSELRPLIMKAKSSCLPRPARITTMQTM